MHMKYFNAIVSFITIYLSKKHNNRLILVNTLTSNETCAGNGRYMILAMQMQYFNPIASFITIYLSKNTTIG